MGEMIAYPSNGQTTPGYLAQPEGGANHPGVVVIQEWWGLVPHIKGVVDRFAQAGYVALAPDLYHGKVTGEPDEARKLAMTLDRDRAVAEILAAARYLQGLDAVSSAKVGVIGWCMGGGLAASAAAESGASEEEIGAVVMFYGRPLSPEDTLKLRVPLLGLFAELDKSIPLDTVHAFAQELHANQLTYEIHIYDGAAHAFFNNTRPQAYHPDAAADAWMRTLAWFAQYLV